MIRERTTQVILIRIDVVPPTAVGAENRESSFSSANETVIQIFFVDVVTLSMGGESRARDTIIKANSRPDFGLVNKDGVLEVRSEGLGRGRIHWVGEARKLKGGMLARGARLSVNTQRREVFRIP